MFIFLFVFLPVCLQAQKVNDARAWVAQDKLVHFTYSMGFTPATIQILELKNVKHSEIKGAAILFAAGVAKEFVIDKNPSFKDITVDFAGCVAGIFLNRLIIKIQKINHAKKQTAPTPFSYP